MEQTLLCKDCRHSFQTWYEMILMVEKRYTLKCRKSFKTETHEPNPVTGPKLKPAHYETCSVARMDFLSKEFNTNCGKQGRWWQPKHKPDLFKYIKIVR